ncbi:bifunctional diaminohydroxyphosphoribosylaminopyrimidine deaminase/5-amino-6-(5-phosphoribosylamino)uracil reductase RibD [Nitratidesulfovibrio sp. SRB-5]|uniref:bifunctional diaminohydroxyphosphoribosylaminopyrimidine deaminase/5-amino-6-(5-phosphoribosylamino)uracil reductase RibD n=1 Tax=Nitratidesulfovibrio sp. SRB-5 TaxID=2872636 RepID=UPI00102586A9|nr:bifunctional diaminohydroxyphosphoribosylaminopyrimidine deaminase/5-amino-6-(5-phosphoribosylamino)uracil reductase RibD [Nitratidesulfovibrio sp. SRB-5]MBZ2171269.1 bifunctional diaminohydroxyphosphoribosylaminopyrimidine deaminase/5-amino-6-(5-phosphoribosylamino)uracil reductase RibD [Nitratidesulfovibrio sp. SRB-5]RXF77329.1 bifunctional diaminohydroxyphosphoribosylaminopyrimidine deaminase/5-amino-6-(5-phosphoribosylamino)uracil reductase RibD [Desulfovibrio sp. DS-1]
MTAPHPFEIFMREAIALARRGRWRAAPNPTVGAVLVRDGQVVARGYHTACGMPHAEVECLRDAAANGVDPAACTLVVTLEPCNHHGKTPPCSQAVLAAGIRHVVVGMADPNPVARGGAEFLRQHGVRVDMGVCEQDCRDLVADFVTWKKTDLPYVILKLASTLDGRIATRAGHSQWISCAASRRRVHAIRAGAGHAGGAVLVGGGTLFADNPLLTARCGDFSDAFPSAPQGGCAGIDEADAPCRQPLAVAVTSRMDEVAARAGDLALLQQRAADTFFWTTETAAASPAADTVRAVGARVWGLPGLDAQNGQDGQNGQSGTDGTTCSGGTGLDLRAGLARLRAEAGCLYVLCEGGGQLGLALLEAGLVHEFELHLAPKVLGDNVARPLFDGRAPLRMDDALGLRVADTAPSGDDIIVTLRQKV